MRIGTDQLSNRIEKKIKMVCFFFLKWFVMYETWTNDSLLTKSCRRWWEFNSPVSMRLSKFEYSERINGGRYGERISIYSEDWSVPTHTNEFRFCTSHFNNQWWNGTFKNKLIHFFLTGNFRLLSSVSKLEFYYKIHTSRTKASLNGKLSVRDNQLFMNWYGKPIDSLLYRESISVLLVTLL